MIDEQLLTRALYGGAIELDIPQRFQDVSDFRPVPDHQEVQQLVFAMQRCIWWQKYVMNVLCCSRYGQMHLWTNRLS